MEKDRASIKQQQQKSIVVILTAAKADFKEQGKYQKQRRSLHNNKFQTITLECSNSKYVYTK